MEGVCGARGSLEARCGDFGGSGFVPESGGVADAGVGEGVEGGGDAAGAEVSEGGSADEVVLVGGLGVELIGEEGDFGEEFWCMSGGDACLRRRGRAWWSCGRRRVGPFGWRGRWRGSRWCGRRGAGIRCGGTWGRLRVIGENAGSVSPYYLEVEPKLFGGAEFCGI